MMDRLSLLKTKILSLLLRAGRLRPLRILVAFFFNHMDAFLPIDLCCENVNWVAFHHPQPDYPLHILILPKQSLPSLMSAPLEGDLYVDLTKVVRSLIADFQLDVRGYRLITNGGFNQTIPQWHWHLISEKIGKSYD
jgi:histidine triad (HIT) family protein